MKSMKAKINYDPITAANNIKSRLSQKAKISTMQRLSVNTYNPLNSSKSSQSRKPFSDKQFITYNETHTTNGKSALKKTSDNDPITSLIKRNRTMTNMIVLQPKGDYDEASGRISKNDPNEKSSSPVKHAKIDEEKENHKSCFESTNENLILQLENIKSNKNPNDEKYSEFIQLIHNTANCSGNIGTLIKNISYLYELKIESLTSENEKTNNLLNDARKANQMLESAQRACAVPNKEMQIIHNNISNSKTYTQHHQSQADMLKAKLTKLCDNTSQIKSINKSANKRNGVPSLDLSKLQKTEGELNLIIKPTKHHHSLSSDSEEGSNNKANKTVCALNEKSNKKANPSVPKLNLFYLKK